LPGEIAEGVELPDKVPMLSNTFKCTALVDLLSLLSPGQTRLPYTMSGHLQFWVTLVAMGHAVPYIVEAARGTGVYEFRGFRPLPLTLIYDHYVQLITASVLGAAALSVYLYVSSFWGKKILAKGGNTGNAVYDFFIGRELNPRVFNNSLDLKVLFC